MVRRHARFRRLTTSVVAATTLGTVMGAAAVGLGQEAASAAPAGSSSLAAATQPAVLLGGTDQAAGNWTLTLGLLSTWSSGDTVTIAVQDKSGSGNTVTFHGAPTVTVASNGANATPTFGTPTLNGTSTAVTLTFTNSNGTPILGAQTVTIAGVFYDVGAAAAPGPVTVTADYTPSGGSASALTATNASNAVVAAATVAANNPAAAAAPGATNVGIGDVVITELEPGGVPTGWVCVTLSAGTFDSGDSPTVTPAGGGAATDQAVSGAGSDTLSFNVTTASTGSKATYTLGSLAVDAPNTTQMVTVSVRDGGSAAGCSGLPAIASGVRAYGALGSSRIFGPTADDTAVAELESQFVPGTNCPPSRAVVLATDASYPDALAASYLAGSLNSGVLLTPTDSLSMSALTAMKVEGIENVYVVGGPLAVSDADVTQLEATAAYNCGGGSAVTPATDLVVTRIGGNTLYDTASMIADAVGSSYVGKSAFPGAYGVYDHGGGAESSSATSGATAVPTAILATGNGFQDAMSASPVAYKAAFPVLLTDPSFLEPVSQASLQSLGIQQVIVMGGSEAISDAVVSQVQDLGIEVLRVAGVDYTDTAVQLAAFELNSTDGQGNADGLGWAGATTFKNTFDLTRGDFYADGLAGCVVAGRLQQPMLLTFDPNTVGSYLTALLNQVGQSGLVLNLLVYGGTSAVADATIQTALDALSQG